MGDGQVPHPDGRDHHVDGEDVEPAGGEVRRVDPLALAVNVPGVPEGVHAPARQRHPVQRVGVVVGREPHGAADDVAALHAVHELRHPHRRELLPALADVVPEERVAAEAVHRIRDHRLRVDGDERRLVLRDGDGVHEGQRLGVIARDRLLAALVVRLLVRRVHVPAGDVDVPDVVEPACGPVRGDGIGHAVRVLEAIVHPCQHARSRQHPAALRARDPLVVDGIELRFARQTGLGRGPGRCAEERDDGDDRCPSPCPSTSSHPAAL